MSAHTANPIPTTKSQSGVPPEPPEALHQAGVNESQDLDQALNQDEATGDDEATRPAHTGMTATYSPDDNKLRLYSRTRLDAATYARVKDAGFRFAPKQALFVAPAWTPGRETLLLALCGEIGDEDTSLVERAEERADRFEGYSDKRGREAHHAHQAVDAIVGNIPMGQPILVGHHTEQRARRDRERIENGMRRAVQLWDTSEYWTRRAAGALRNAKYKVRADVRHRRIKTLEAERRAYGRSLADKTAALAAWESAQTLEQGKAVADVWRSSCSFSLAEYPREAPASQYEGPMSLWSALDGNVITLEQARNMAAKFYPPSIARAQRWTAHFDKRLSYERAMLAEQGGIKADGFDIVVGGKALVSGEWVVVVHAQFAQSFDLVEEVAHLHGGLLQGRHPQPSLHRRAVLAGACQQMLPFGQTFGIESLEHSMEQLRLAVPGRFGNESPEFTVGDQQDSVLVEPAFEFRQQPAGSGATGKGFSQPTHDVAALVLGHLPESQSLIGELLVVAELVHPRRHSCAPARRRGFPSPAGHPDSEELERPGDHRCSAVGDARGRSQWTAEHQSVGAAVRGLSA